MSSLLGVTSRQFSQTVVEQCGRGAQQAVALYKSFFRQGILDETLPEFRNAPKLYSAICHCISPEIYPVSCVHTEDSAVRFLLTTPEGYSIESVVLSMVHGKTICVSSQIGCRMGCRFCQTGKRGLLRNLTAHEIVMQVFVAYHVLKMPVKNVVFMGMGEPFDNFSAVMNAIDILQDAQGFQIGPRHITVSTSGELAGILQLAEKKGAGPNLTVSINAAEDSLRHLLMPARRNDTLADLHRAIKTYTAKKGKRVYLSYVLLRGVNDTTEHANRLALFVRDLDTRVNLIPYNILSDGRYLAPEASSIESFLKTLRESGAKVFLRGEKGGSIFAACGQLGLNNV